MNAPPVVGRYVLMLVAGLALLVPSPSARSAPPSSIAALAPAYDEILNTHFDQVERTLTDSCAAPAEACQVLLATSSWWRILQNPNDTSLDEAFSARADQAIAAAERWTAREPSRADAWFYLGGAYGARVSFRVQRGQHLAAARDGRHIKDALEHALVLDPAVDDARFGVGLYRYYADIAPTAAKVVRFLLQLPGGDRVGGLRDMEAVHQHGSLLKGEADYQLHWIYLWYENQPRRGLTLIRDLHEHYPASVHFATRVAEIENTYFHDSAASLAVWRTLADDAARTGDATLAEASGRLGAAAMLDALAESDRALEQVERVIAMRPARPYGAVAKAQWQRGTLLERFGDHRGAVTAYQAALGSLPDGDADGIGEKVRASLRQTPPDPRTAEAYRTSLTGWRAFERGTLDQAAAALGHAATLAPHDPVIAVRLARVQQARGEIPGAMTAYDAIIASRPAPPLALAPAYVWSAEALEARGDLDGARLRYRAATHVFAADSRITAAAQRALERTGK